MNTENSSARIGDPLCGTWLHATSDLILEIEEYGASDYVLVKKANGEYFKQIVETAYLNELDAFSLDLSVLEVILSTEPIGSSLFYSQEKDRIILSRVSENIAELSVEGSAYVFISDAYAATPLTATEQTLFNETSYEISLAETDISIGFNLVDPNDIDSLPDWWTDDDTAKFIDELAEEVKRAIEEKFDLEEQIEQKVLERVIEKAAAKILAKKLAEREASKIVERLIREGKTREQAELIARRLAKKLEREYLYKHPRIWQRFNPLRKLQNLKKLLKSPKSWLRGKVAKFFIKGLGKRVLAIPGLIDDLLTIGEALYRWWQAKEAWEGAKEAWKQSRELERELERFRRNLTPEQRQQIEDLYRREKEYFEQLRKEHRERSQQRVCPEEPPVVVIGPGPEIPPQALISLASVTKNQITKIEGQYEGEFGFQVVVSRSPILADIPADTPDESTASPLVFLENGQPLDYPHSLHADIEGIGQGRYSHWNGGGGAELRFSTSDNSDPRANGRVYSIAVPSGTQLAVIQSDQIIKVQGEYDGNLGYRVHVSTLDFLARVPADSTNAPKASPLVLLENGVAFGQKHSQHADIQRIGQGRYSHWDGGGNNVYLWFSTPDNTDPRTNGRTYALSV